MPVINLIDCKTKKTITNYLFALCIVNKGTTKSNITVFKDLNINQLRYNKDDPSFEKNLTF